MKRGKTIGENGKLMEAAFLVIYPELRCHYKESMGVYYPNGKYAGFRRGVALSDTGADEEVGICNVTATYGNKANGNVFVHGKVTTTTIVADSVITIEGSRIVSTTKDPETIRVTLQRMKKEKEERKAEMKLPKKKRGRKPHSSTTAAAPLPPTAVPAAAPTAPVPKELVKTPSEPETASVVSEQAIPEESATCKPGSELCGLFSGLDLGMHGEGFGCHVEPSEMFSSPTFSPLPLPSFAGGEEFSSNRLFDFDREDSLEEIWTPNREY